MKVKEKRKQTYKDWGHRRQKAGGRSSALLSEEPRMELCPLGRIDRHANQYHSPRTGLDLTVFSRGCQGRNPTQEHVVGETRVECIDKENKCMLQSAVEKEMERETVGLKRRVWPTVAEELCSLFSAYPRKYPSSLRATHIYQCLNQRVPLPQHREYLPLLFDFSLTLSPLKSSR
jgi:hypothetical protein